MCMHVCEFAETARARARTCARERTCVYANTFTFTLDELHIRGSHSELPRACACLFLFVVSVFCLKSGYWFLFSPTHRLAVGLGVRALPSCILQGALTACIFRVQQLISLLR